MSSTRVLFAFSINLLDMVANILLRSIKQILHLLHIKPHILALESHINTSYSVLILIYQESLFDNKPKSAVFIKKR